MASAKFRKFVTSSGKIVLGGKNAENNELLVEQAKTDELVLHTAKPGSPFCNIKGKASKEDIYEAAVFCAKYSQDWRDNHRDVEIHVFSGKDVCKEKDMKLGTFGVKKFKRVIAKKQDIEKLR